MNKKGMALIEIVVGMIILAVASLAVTATIFLVNSTQMRNAAGSSVDLEAQGYARETLDWLRNAVTTDPTRSGPLVVSTSSYSATASLPASFRAAPLNGTRTYKVTSVASTDLRKVTVAVVWND